MNGKEHTLPIDEEMMCSQENPTADPAASGSVGGLRLTPVTSDQPASKQGCVRTAGVDSYRPQAKSRRVGEAQVQGSSRVLTPQQLNSRRQNERRAKLKVEEKAAWLRDQPEACGEVKRPAAAEPGRLLGAVADFWERKKRRLDTNLASEGTSLSGER